MFEAPTQINFVLFDITNPSCWRDFINQPPVQLTGKGRPAWYVAQIIAALGLKQVRYAGHSFNGQTYLVHGRNGPCEQVPENFLKALPVDARLAEHVLDGKVKTQGPAPEIWFAH